MSLNESILKLLQKTYKASAMNELQFKNLDLAFKTDELGRPILLFIGKKDNHGNIKGERYARVLKFTRDGKLLKDHWELKGTAT
jgi:hypothetical protein